MREVTLDWKSTDAGRAGEWICNYKKVVTGVTGEGVSGTQGLIKATFCM